MDSEPDSATGPPSPGGDEPLVRPADGGAGGELAAGSPEPAPGDPGPAVGSRVGGRRGHGDSHNMLPPRERRRLAPERFLVRLIATGGIVGIGTAIAAIMASSHSQGWIIGIVVSAVSVILAAILWSSRQL
jgi:hypothetical protein